jgi:hypothetical protein
MHSKLVVDSLLLLCIRLRVELRVVSVHLYAIWSWGYYAILSIVISLLLLDMPLLLLMSLMLQILDLCI